MSEQGWIGVDLDGTLAFYDGWRGVDHIGEPVPAMLVRVKQWLAEGKDVRVFTARISVTPVGPVCISTVNAHHRSIAESNQARHAIEVWCEHHIGQRLPVTNVKDFGMVSLYDDRAVGVECNTGRLIGTEND